MKFIAVLSTLLLVAFAGSAFAQDQGQDQDQNQNKKPRHSQKAHPKKARHADDDDSYDSVPWGMAGCSIWNFVIKEKERDPQIGVWALEHFVFGVQSSAITTGTSNCVNPSTRTAENEQEVFVNVNLASLQKEAAQGQGEHLATLAEIFGCQNKDGFAQMSQSRYEAIFANETPLDIVQTYKREIQNSHIPGFCSRAG